MASGKFSPKRALALVRESQAMDLRLGGATYEEIGVKLGITTKGAHKAVCRAIAKMVKQTSEASQDVLTIELARLDKLLAAVWVAATAAASQKPVDKLLNLKAVDRVLKIMERRSKFMGLDAPTKTFVGDMGDAEILRDLANSVLEDPESQRLLDSLVARAGKPSDDGNNAIAGEVGPG